MIRNLKALGLTIMAVLAVSAITASASSASNFHSDAENTSFTGTQTGTHVFTAAESTITCTGATFAGTQKGFTAAEIFSTAAYSGCKVHILGFELAANVTMNNCEYTFHSNGTVGVVNRGALNCNTSPITYRVSNFLGECDVKVGATGNGALSKVTYDGTTTVASPPSDIVVTPNVSGITYTSSGGLCPKTGTFSDGKYSSGPTTVVGYKDPSSHTLADRVPIWVTH